MPLPFTSEWIDLAGRFFFEYQGPELSLAGGAVLMSFLVSLLIPLAAVFFPAGELELAKARLAACFLEKGMTRGQAEAALGVSSLYGYSNSLGSLLDCPAYRLRIRFYRGKLVAVYYLGIELLPNGWSRYINLQELPLR
jgi:hypothetical protein